VKIDVEPEGREGMWLPDRASLKEWLAAQNFEAIHNFIASGPMMLGADHDPSDVLRDIDAGERVAILTGDAQKANLSHALAIILDNKLNMYDVGPISDEDLKTSDDPVEPPEGRRMRRITEALMHHGHYDLAETEPDCVQWMKADAERVLAGPLTYEGIDEALIDTALHDPTECNDVCVQAVLEAVRD
jgi:hypothetical protein